MFDRLIEILTVIASEAKQSRAGMSALDCFGALRLAMTVRVLMLSLSKYEGAPSPFVKLKVRAIAIYATISSPSPRSGR